VDVTPDHQGEQGLKWRRGGRARQSTVNKCGPCFVMVLSRVGHWREGMIKAVIELSSGHCISEIQHHTHASTLSL
jgi:hypothetical protein